MNQHLQIILNLIQQAEHFTEEEKTALSKAAKNADKELEITSFKLERTEKVKRTTAILLEETIEELENKRKAVEAQNHELEIEAALERVRAIAMSMNKPDDMLDVCRIISNQLELLNVKEIRNVQTAIFYESKGTYMNYEYYARHNKTIITETSFTNHKMHREFAAQMIKGKGEFFTTYISKTELPDWIAYQKTTNVFIDTYLETASSISYYWHSLGPVALGISTYEPLKEEETNLFRRFLKVFELSYRRYLDIEKAIAQAREAQIELALERVRARTMAMQHSDELGETASVLFEQFDALGEVPERVAIEIVNEKEHVFEIWATQHGGKQLDLLLKCSLDEPHVMQKMYRTWKEQKRSITIDLQGKELEEYFEFLKDAGLPVQREIFGKRRIQNVATFSKGILTIITPEPRPQETIQLLERFAAVFDGTYTRFLDLQKAEAQAREAQIEAALERVRSRSLAMHKSEQLADIISTICKEILNLGIQYEQMETCYIATFEGSESVGEIYLSTSGGDLIPHSFRISFNEDHFFKQLFAAWQNGDAFFVGHLQGEELKNHLAYLFSHLPEAILEMRSADFSVFPSETFTHALYFSRGYLAIITRKPVPGYHQLFKRFGSTLQQSYTRFLDLQKAEAQARESQIQLALERVRARTMAMQHSDELPDAANILFQQMQALGMPAWSAGYCIWDDDHQAITLWMSSAGIIQKPFRALVTEDPSFIHFYDAWKKGETFYVEEIGGDAIVSHYQYMLQLPVVGEMLHQFIADGSSLPTFQIFHLAFFSQGFLLFITYEPVPEAHDIFKRFGKVFEQTYTRFLDLQKAETQAREAQIEAALEKVRSRSLAVHKTEEFKDVVKIVFEKLQELGIETEAASINIIIEGSKDIEVYIGGHSNGGLDIRNFRLLYLDDILSNDRCSAQQSGIDFFSKTYSKEEKDRFFKYQFEFSEMKNVPDDVREIIFNSSQYTVSMAFARHSITVVNNFEGKLLSAHEVDVLKRFSKVFEQAYVRFLDLQKAEAQSRESQIQLALERARAQSMMMQHSTELDDTLRVFHEQVLLLSIPSAFSFLWLPDEEKDRHIFWAAWAEDNATVFKSKAINYPLDRNEPATAQCLIDWKSNEPVVSYHVSPEGVENYFAAWSELIAGVEELKPENFSDGLYYVEAFMKYGCFGVMVKNELQEDEKKILERFAIEFERAYTRFLDLQKAEAQTREAQIQLALERVRAKTMAMHSSEDVTSATETMFEELKKLGLDNLRGGIANIHPEKTMEVFGITNMTDGKTMGGFTLFDVNAHPIWQRLFESWNNKEEVFIDYLTGAEKEDYINVVNSHQNYLPRSIGEFPDTYFQSYHFDQGNIWTFSLQPHSDTDREIMKRFASVFALTFRRYQDLKQAEAQAHEALIEAALERVRARTMAMQHSDELKEAAALLFQQVKSLGAPAYSCGYNIWEKDEKEFTSWMSTQDGSIINGVPNIPLTEDANFIRYVESKQNGEQFFVLELRGERMQEHYEYLKTIPAFKGYFDYAVSVGFDLPQTQIHHIANFSQGNLLFITLEPCPEFHDVFKRFGKVFEQTYTRFLDLQKAEEQARESQIELALERVRARTMAMQKSDELKEVIQLVYQQFVHLNIHIEHTGFLMDYKTRDDLHIWLADHHLAPSEITIPWFDSIPNNSIKEAKEKGKNSFTYHLDFEEKNKFYRELFKFIPDVPEETMNYYLTCPGLAGSGVLLENIGLYIENFEGIPYTDEDNNTLMRLGKVFQQTYTRFLDLETAEAQARESQIQLALERVRARTMAMQSADELIEVANVMRHQMVELGQPGLDTAAVHLYSDNSEYFDSWYAFRQGDPVTGNLVTGKARFKKDSCELLREIVDAYYSKRGDYSVEFTGIKLREWFALLGETVPDIKINLDNNFETGVGYFHMSDFSGGSLVMATIQPPTQEAMTLQKRCAAAFDLAYRRFLDLQKAEAQAREAQIEAALEKIRSRSLGMHKSEELRDVIATMFKNMKELDVIQGSLAIQLFDPKTMNSTFWLSSELKNYPLLINLPYDQKMMNENTCLKDSWQARLSGESIINKEYSFKQKNKYFGYVFANNDLTVISAQDREFIMQAKKHIICLLVEKTSALFADSWNGQIYSEQRLTILKRAARVFEQAYVRFLDLQKAETQAREAQVQLALERVRARTMAMQKSEELMEAANLLFQQVQSLGIPVWGCGYNIWEKGENLCTGWMSTHDAVQPSFRIPLTEHRTFIHMNESRLKAEPFYVEEVSGEALADHYRYMFSLPDFKEIATKQLQDGFTLPLSQINHVFNFTHGNLIFLSAEAIPEAWDIFKRFTAVFEQTYTRFLDLQKAEAQAREAQIETALEKVRSRSLAMHKSEELQEVVHTVFDKLKELNVDLYTAIIFIFKEGSKDVVWWLANKANQQYARILVPYADIHYLKNLFDSKESGKDFFAATYSFEEKNELFHHLFEHTDFKYVPEPQKEFLLESELATMSIALAKNTGINITSYSRKSFSESDNEILKRFAKVFDQAYTRFLDLQKAEAQAREAQIEAALEKVRSRTIAMHKSEELIEVIASVFQQLEHLSFRIDSANLFLNYKENPFKFWMAVPGYLYPSEIDVPYGDFALMNRFIREIKSNATLVTAKFNQEEKNEWVRHLIQHSVVGNAPDEKKKQMFEAPGLAMSVAGVKNIALAITNYSVQSYSDEENEILRRFVIVFDQTYTRFLDLQKAEAHALEAIKRASVDRVRAEIASMRTTTDLERITPLIWNELTTLGVPFVRCGVFIMDEEKQLVETHLSTPDGKAIASFTSTFSGTQLLTEILPYWQRKEIYKAHWDEARFLEQAKSLVQQGSVTSGEKYLTENRPTDLYLHFLPFLQGMLYAGNTAPLSDDELQLMQNLADAFSTAYARYEDFNKLEEAKGRIETTLSELKATQHQLVQSEKMASLGELTAGIAHEIQNPLNFVNNFSEVNSELISELVDEVDRGNIEEAKAIAKDIKDNEEKITHHGKRADAIVKGMLQHSRKSEGKKEPTDINALCDEYLRLSYHGLRAKDKSFNADFKTDFDTGLSSVEGKIDIVPQDIGRVLLNLYNNAFYAVKEKSQQSMVNSPQPLSYEYKPLVSVQTKSVTPLQGMGAKVEIKVTDNGSGIPKNIIDKIFQPFFTTKPTGQGTGLGLSLSYDIIKAHGGEIKVETKEGEGSEFVIMLPL